jgi:hypothetical protein
MTAARQRSSKTHTYRIYVIYKKISLKIKTESPDMCQELPPLSKFDPRRAGLATLYSMEQSPS